MSDLDTENQRQSDEDRKRDAAVYLHLLNNLTDLDISEDNPKPNEYKIAKQWGQNRIFVRRVLRSVMGERYQEKEREERIPSLSLGKLVTILTSLEAYWQGESAKNKDSLAQKMINKFTQQEKERVLKKYAQLSLDERKKLGLLVHPEAGLLEQLKEIITDEIQQDSLDVVSFYKQAINLYSSQKQQHSYLKSLDANDHLDIDEYFKLVNQITEYIQPRLKKYYQHLSTNSEQEIIKDLVDKILREVSRTEFQAGLRQIKTVVEQCPDFVKNNLTSDSISNLFLESLSNSIIKNNLLGDKFPVYIDYLEIEKVKPLPLKLYRGKTGLINPYFLDDPEDENEYYAQGLEKQIAYRVRVYFYVYPPENWKPKPTLEILEISQFFKQEESNNRLEFCEEVVGVGSPIAHITTAINRFLFEGIDILKKPEGEGYLPVTQKIVSEDKVIGNTRNSAVWSYSLVKLCKQKDVKNSLKDEIDYNQIVADQELATGEFYGFDLLESAAKSALHARLRAIEKTGIDSQQYLQQLCQRIEEKYILKKAENWIKFYPFSLRAMQDYLEKKLFKDKYRNWDERNFKEVNNNQAWSMVAYEAHLAITQVYLQEGLYRIAKKYLEVIKPHIEDGRLDDKLLVSLYHICLFDYHFYTDLEDEERDHQERGSAIRKAEECLNIAEEYLQEYLKEYAIIGEYSQTNVHPFFYYLSRIYSHRAKIYLFFPYIAQLPSPKTHLLIEPLRLLEKARIYAARDGDANYYAYWTVYQIWSYLITAYVGDTKLLKGQFTRQNCLEWAERLIKNALDCYGERGRKSYQQIKNYSGKQTEFSISNIVYEQYNDIYVQTIPPIIEIGKGSSHLDEFYQKIFQSSQSQQKIIQLPMSALTYLDSNSDNKIYLFGIHASLLLFGLGLVELCKDNQEEGLEERILMAMKRFTLGAAIASEGTVDEKRGEKTYLQRIFTEQKQNNNQKMPEDFQIRGLYPHRLTQFTAKGKIFAATCRVILLLYNYEKYNSYWPEVAYLLNDLHDAQTIIRSNNPDYSLGQNRYSGHLVQQFKGVKSYLESQKNSGKSGSLEEIRNRIVTDIFKILRGDKV
ncbi:MAG: HypX (modular protein) [Microcystis sp. M038S2]|uniref:HypX (Modular protein) n=1 Tax=Microcystis aeruginosa G11-04 TaxID=2685956 RepID=A0A966FWL1_MICAE|nr:MULTISPECIES: HypX (modular protein) [unclassified Microcystis]NCS55428.1 HypX (modular protein) [Microcystis aeruginosa G11-04]NCT41898.1 HypX (modular protein) [Microcystis aeruginosa G11-09]NCT63866.1 HypX (modular protein) [Microcystis aeruginosa G13-01]TRU64687.1 MAG: HypX (modular protein) [Microcystis aeruginosa Ma_QC_C_20070823_S13D]TRU65267.1 MAG: HypX (modular protein) [Microcystis aeruginosa Ma_QC_C_20070823_S13]